MLLMTAIVIPHISVWGAVVSQPMQAMYSGVITFFPNPPIAGQTESISIEVRNVGSVVFKVTSLELRTDWAVAYYATDVPQVIDAGASYKFAPLSVPIPSSAVGSHTFSTRFWVQVPTSSGSWSQDYVEKLGDVTLNIESGLAITGTTTIVMPTQEYTCDQVNCYIVMQGTTIATFTGLQQKLTQQTSPNIEWRDLLTIGLVVIVIALIALLSIQRKSRQGSHKEKQVPQT